MASRRTPGGELFLLSQNWAPEADEVLRRTSNPQGSRFDILTICIDEDGELKSIADLDRRLEPIVKHVWGGRPLPFPILLDNTFQTWERFGLPGLGTVLLIDPEGNLVKGDEAASRKSSRNERVIRGKRTPRAHDRSQRSSAKWPK